MNCIKCNTPISEGKSFCPNCGHFNEPAASNKPTASSLSVASRLRDSEFIMALASKSNTLALIGGLLSLCSVFLPFYIMKDLIHNKVIIEMSPYRFFPALFSVDKLTSVNRDFLDLLFYLLLITFIGGIITVVCAVAKHRKTFLASSLTGLVGLPLLAIRPTVHAVVDNQLNFVFGLGFYVFSLGVICLLISAGATLLNRKVGTN